MSGQRANGLRWNIPRPIIVGAAMRTLEAQIFFENYSVTESDSALADLYSIFSVAATSIKFVDSTFEDNAWKGVEMRFADSGVSVISLLLNDWILCKDSADSLADRMGSDVLNTMKATLLFIMILSRNVMSCPMKHLIVLQQLK